MNELRRQIASGFVWLADVEPVVTSEDLKSAEMSEQEARDELKRLFGQLAENSQKLAFGGTACMGNGDLLPGGADNALPGVGSGD